MSSPWERLLERPRSGEHFVQVYESDESGLSRNVCLYIWKGLQLGDGILLVTTPEHTELFSQGLKKLGADVPALLAGRQLVFFDAQQTMAKFMVSGQPDWEQFARVICAAMRDVKPAEGSTGLRAYGEMVGVLWKARQFAAAIRLEQFWNKMLEQSSFSLYCAYAIDVFGKEFDVASLDGLLCTHTHMLPARSDGKLEASLNRSIDEILGPDADALRIRIKSRARAEWAVMPAAEGMMLWLRKNLPDDQADQIIERARHNYHQTSVSP